MMQYGRASAIRHDAPNLGYSAHVSAFCISCHIHAKSASPSLRASSQPAWKLRDFVHVSFAEGAHSVWLIKK
jgi:hypothetical protein